MSTETIEKHSAADARCRKCRTDLAGDENFSCSKKYTCFVLNCTKDNRCGKNSLCNYCYRNAGPKTINIRLRSLIAGYENVDSKLGGPSSTDKIATSFGTKLDETLSSMKDMFTRNESYKCGSAAKGTGIGGYSDLDLVVALTWNESESGRTVVPMLASILEAAPSFDIEVLCKNDVSLRVRFDSLEIDIIPVEFKDWRKSLEDRVEMFKESQEKDRKKLRLNPSSTLFMKEQVGTSDLEVAHKSFGIETRISIGIREFKATFIIGHMLAKRLSRICSLSKRRLCVQMNSSLLFEDIIENVL
eukprot:m.906483 g.906483  ORF g.906483 m.906483 type:complete len:302 (-) comp23706_c0_seq1:2252-3157(-)